MCLSELGRDSEAIVKNLSGDQRFISRITSIGLTPGCNLTRPEALAFIFAITFNMPCVVALAATYQETASAKWTVRIALYYTASALILSTIVYHIGLLIW